MTKTVPTGQIKPKIRAEQALLHWHRPRCTLTLDAALVREVPVKLAVPGVDGMEAAALDEMVGYEAVFATEDHWMLRLWSYDREAQRYAARWTQLKLRLAKNTVSAPLETFAGVPVLWSHWSWGSPAAGRVVKMTAAGGTLSGSMVLSSLALAGYGTSIEQIDAGMNVGLSIGFRTYDEPKMKRADGDDGGTFDKPDTLTFGRIGIIEVSLTPTPMISQAGIKGKSEGKEI